MEQVMHLQFLKQRGEMLREKCSELSQIFHNLLIMVFQHRITLFA